MKTLNPTLLSIATFGIVTLVSLENQKELDLLNIAMLYMLPILVAAVFSSTIKTAFISFGSVLTFNVLFVPPTFSLTVHDSRYFLSFAIMFSVGILVSILAQKAAKIKELELSEKLSKALMGSLSHELRTPLAATIGAASTLLNDDIALSNDQKKSLYENIFESSTRMQKLVETLLAEARFAGNIKPILKECDIAENIGSVLSKIEQKYSKKAAFEIRNPLPTAMTDAELFEQAISILIDNAFKYGEDVKITAQKDISTIEISITNSGTLPTKEEMAGVGKKLNRLSNSRGTDGSGLGLYLCLKIAEILDAKLDISVKDALFCVNLKIPAIT